MSAFHHNVVIKMSDTDAAGFVFFARVYDYAHFCYEAFLRKNGLPISNILSKENFLLPIVHSSADYKEPLKLDQQITIVLSLEKCSPNSFCLNYEFFNENHQLMCQLKTVHVAICSDSLKKIELPKRILEIIKRLE